MMSYNQRHLQQPCIWVIVLLSGALLLRGLLTICHTQVTTAITPDGTLGTVVIQNGNIHDITGGTRPGNGPNLFHSFDRFSVGRGDTARFNGPAGIENVISRVTGGQTSSIDGQLQLTISGANLFLLNPSGAVFGTHATLNVPGSFHVSTADFVRLEDGAVFSATLEGASQLSVAPPRAFGFLQTRPASIAIQDSFLVGSPGKSLSVIGGDIEIVRGSLRSPSGQVNLVSVASAGEVLLGPTTLAGTHGGSTTGHDLPFDVSSFASLGNLRLEQTFMDVGSSAGRGTVVIRSGHLVIDGGLIFANTPGDVDGARLGIDIQVTDDAVISNGGRILTNTGNSGRGSDIVVMARTLRLTGGASIASIVAPRGTGQGGTVTVTAVEAIIIEDGLTGFSSLTSGEGNAGHIVILAPTLRMDGGAIQTVTFNAGPGGDVIVQVETLTLNSGAFFNSLTLAAGQGGSIIITATDSAVIIGTQDDFFPQV